VFGAQRIVGIGRAPVDLAEDQPVRAHPRAPHPEAARAAHPQAQQAVGRGVEILDPRLGPDRRRRRRRAGLLARKEQAHAEAAAAAPAFADHVEVAGLEDAQAERAAGHQHGAQREQRQARRRRFRRPVEVGHGGVAPSAHAPATTAASRPGAAAASSSSR